jgi:regulator of sigma E protease
LAQQIGLQTGDKIIKINGKEFTNFDDIAKPDVLLSQNSSFTVLRGNQELTISIPPDFIENFNKREAAGNFLMPRTVAIVDRVKENTLADKVGLKKDDQFVEVEGHPVAYFDELSAQLKDFKKDTLHFKIKRGDQVLSFSEYFKGQNGIGFYRVQVPEEGQLVVNYSLGQAIVLGPEKAFDVIFVQFKAFRKIFNGDISFRKSLSGPIGMAQAYGGEWDWERFWRMTGLLSMVLAFMNLLPIPALDGGYVMFLLYEMVSGREPSEKFFENALKVGMALLLVLMVFVFYNDIAKLFTGG